MDIPVPYMPSKKNLPDILDAVRKAAVPEQFTHEFLSDLGFTSSNDRPVIKLFRYIGLLDGSNRPTDSYRQFMNAAEAKGVLASCLRKAYDDLFKSNQDAPTKAVAELKGWFKSKTGDGDSVADKIATTFKALCDYADFTSIKREADSTAPKSLEEHAKTTKDQSLAPSVQVGMPNGITMVYRIEVHLPDTQNLETYRAIFRAIREELRQ